MDQLIQRLQEKIAILIQELDEARAQIETLKQTAPETVFSEAQSPYDLLSQMSDLAPSDKLQMYIEDSLDIDPFEHLEPSNNTGDKKQLGFDLPLTDEKSTPLPSIENALAIENKVILEDLSPAETAPTESTPVESGNENVLSDASAVELSTDNQENTSVDEGQTAEVQPSPRKRNKNKQNNLKLIQLLEKKYPKAFNWNNPSPLKIGIDKEMQIDEELTESKLKRALAAYTRSDRYKKSLAKQKIRIDLNGKPVLPKKMSNRPTDTTPSNNKPQQQQPKKQHKPAVAKIETAPHDGLSDEERMKKKLAMLLAKK